MPVQGTIGGASARGVGLFGGLPKPAFPAGTFGIATVGASSTATVKYTFASDTAAAYSSLLASNGSSQMRASVANVYYGIFCVGGLGVNTTNKMIWATGSVIVGANTPTSGAFNCGMSNSALGLIIRGINSAGAATGGTFLYNFAPNTCVAGSDLGVNTQFSGGCGTSTFGMTNVGVVSSNVTLAKYTYSTNAVIGGTNLVTPSWHAPAFGNAVVGIFGVGTPTTSLATQKYTWAADTVAVSGNLVKACANGAAMSTDVSGFTVSGTAPSTSINKYSFATDICVNGGTLTSGINSGTMAIPNGQVGVSA